MSLLDVVTTYSPVLGFLLLRDLPQVQVAHPLLRAALEGSAAWWEAACRALPDFEVPEELFEAPSRVEALRLLPPLLGARVAAGLREPLGSLEQARKLSKQLAAAQKTARAHAAKGGTVAQALLARLAFPENVEAALVRDLGGEDAAALPLSFGTPIDCPGTKRPVAIHLALRNGTLLLGARDDGAASAEVPMGGPDFFLQPERPGEESLTIDVTSASSALLLHYRGVGVLVNGTWESAASGMLTFSKGRKSAARALAEGILCVLAVRDGLPEVSARLAQTLHLDTVRR